MPNLRFWRSSALATMARKLPVTGQTQNANFFHNLALTQPGK
jgi:hypothetical protein